jgi:hypothetical protein
MATTRPTNTGTTSSGNSLAWGRAGTANKNTWLINESIPSNVTGRNIFRSGSKLTNVYVASDNSTTYTLELYEHDGVTYTLLTTLTVTALRSASFVLSPSISLTQGKELAIKIGNGSAKNIVVGAIVE